MIERQAKDLHFSRSREPIPTVEVDMNSIPDDLFGYSETVVTSLRALAAASPELRATIYVYQGQSINFHTPSWSAFIGVDGPVSFLKLIHHEFEGIPGVKVRMSDYIHPSQGLCEFHIEDGKVWRPVDAVTWHAEDAAVKNVVEDEWGNEPEAEQAESDDEGPEGVGARARTPGRLRAARGDASVGRIRRKIEEVFGLPEGSVALCGPDGQALRADARIATLRKRWG
ncbi:hypothetical protein FAZ95_01160 [Trinickia violacea]|uniref:Uncharacterized protein n=1 Tax=Trinickia violacea TaxID=2571746 RepID=A0A4P8IPS6_9BURK|nr:hypothetical protein [Trinickia violacea]QCP47909.1 hypothetical protein FAZ95_01160 [Trinickia violacea]